MIPVSRRLVPKCRLKMMITESNYMELMKNCSKWNSRSENERRQRFKRPYYEQQTGTPHRLVPGYHKTKIDRCNTNDPNTAVQYEAKKWKKVGHAPADAIEMKMFLRDNPALDAAVNQAAVSVPQEILQLQEIITADPIMSTSKGTPKMHTFEDFTDDLDDDMSPGSLSDEDDWGSKKKKNKGVTHKKKKASAAESRPHDPHACNRCGAKYKSFAGLSYHNAFVHKEPPINCLNKLLSPNIEISDFCDLCLGNKFMNKNSKKAEDLVTCHDCGRSGHPTCLQFNTNVPIIINKYGWQCIECKSCTICGTSENDDQLLFCDDCDRGFHLYCLKPALKKAPENEYSCVLCQVEFGDRASAPAAAASS